MQYTLWREHSKPNMSKITLNSISCCLLTFWIIQTASQQQEKSEAFGIGWKPCLYGYGKPYKTNTTRCSPSFALIRRKQHCRLSKGTTLSELRSARNRIAQWHRNSECSDVFSITVKITGFTSTDSHTASANLTINWYLLEEHTNYAHRVNDYISAQNTNALLLHTVKHTKNFQARISPNSYEEKP